MHVYQFAYVSDSLFHEPSKRHFICHQCTHLVKMVVTPNFLEYFQVKLTTLAFQIVWAVRCTFRMVKNVKLTRLVWTRRTGWDPMYKRSHSLEFYGRYKTPAAISLRKRWQIVGMSSGGMRPGAIATQLHVSRKSVWSTLSLHRRTQDVTPGKSSGHPRKTTARQNLLLFGMLRRGRRRSAASHRDEWRNDLERPVSMVTVNRKLLERSYRARRPVMKPKLTARHKDFVCVLPGSTVISLSITGVMLCLATSPVPCSIVSMAELGRGGCVEKHCVMIV